jgi:hypothetical protein
MIPPTAPEQIHDTVIHYDPWWNPAVENQATDRAHRIGQDKPVFVYTASALDHLGTASLRLPWIRVQPVSVGSRTGLC